MKYLFHALLFIFVFIFTATNSFSQTTQTRAVKSIPGGLDMSVNNVPTSFDAGDVGSRVITGLFGFTHIAVLTDSTTCSFAINTTHDAVAPADNDPGNFNLIAGVPGVILDGPYIGPSVYVRSIGSACMADYLYIWVW